MATCVLIPSVLAAEALRRGHVQAPTPGLKARPLDPWPGVPTKFLLCRDDRLFPAGWPRRVVRERPSIVTDEFMTAAVDATASAAASTASSPTW